MHASIEELLSLRDGEPGPQAAAAHVADCARCRTELDQLRHVRTALSALPLQEPAPSAWAEITARAARPERPRKALVLGSAFAAAAALALIGLLVARMQEPASTQAPALATTTPAPAPSTSPVTSAAPDTEALIARSRRLEAALARVRYEPQVVNAGTAATIEALEEHIALVDYRLNLDAADPLPAEQSHRLWQQRVDLMDSLVSVRYAQLQRISY
jgi:hypothetical protein